MEELREKEKQVMDSAKEGGIKPTILKQAYQLLRDKTKRTKLEEVQNLLDLADS